MSQAKLAFNYFPQLERRKNDQQYLIREACKKNNSIKSEFGTFSLDTPPPQQKVKKIKMKIGPQSGHPPSRWK